MCVAPRWDVPSYRLGILVGQAHNHVITVVIDPARSTTMVPVSVSPRAYHGITVVVCVVARKWILAHSEHTGALLTAYKFDCIAFRVIVTRVDFFVW